MAVILIFLSLKAHINQLFITKMAASDYKLAYITNSLLSEFEKRALDIICYQFTQYQGRDWRVLAAGLGFNKPSCMKSKVRISEFEIDTFDQAGATLHEKLHLVINRFVLNCRLVGLEFDLVQHLVEVLDGGLNYHTPYHILIESILYEKLKY